MFTEYVLNLIQKAERGEPIEMRTGDWGLLIYESFTHYFSKQGTRAVVKPEPKKVRAVLTSGGLDSTVAYYMARKMEEIDGVPVRTFYARITTGYEEHELAALNRLGIEPEIIELPIEHDWDRWGYIIPGRNLAFILAVAEKLNLEGYSGEIWMASLDGEWKPSGNDKSMVFVSTLNRILATLPHPFELRTPLKTKTKVDLIRWWMDNQLPIEQLLETRTCQSSTEEHCGRCEACFIRWVAMKNNGIEKLQKWENGDVAHSFRTNTVIRQKVEEAFRIYRRGHALASEEQSFKSASEIVSALMAEGVDLEEVG